MNIIKWRQHERLERIDQMQRSIAKAKKPDLKKLTLSASSEWGISDRTAKEYLKVALFNLEND